MVDTIYVSKNMARNKGRRKRDFYLVEGEGEDQYNINGAFSLEEAKVVIDKLILQKEAMMIDTWLPTTAPPILGMDIEQMFKKPDKLKSAASKCLKWAMKPQGVRMGEVRLHCIALHNIALHSTPPSSAQHFTAMHTAAEQCRADTFGQGEFKGWSYPVDRALFVHCDKYLGSITSATFSMDSILPWTSLGKLKNGLASGNTSLLRPGTGISSWLALLRIFLEVKTLLSLVGTLHFTISTVSYSKVKYPTKYFYQH